MSEPPGTSERKLLERLSVAIQATGLQCWEFSIAEGRFTWFDGMSGEELCDQVALQRRSEEVFSGILPEDSAAVCVVTLQAMDAGEESSSHELRMLDSAGKLRHVRLYQRFVR